MNPMHTRSDQSAVGGARRVRCDGSGLFTGLAPGHFDRCVDCGRSVPTTVEHRLSTHYVTATAEEARNA